MPEAVSRIAGVVRGCERRRDPRFKVGNLPCTLCVRGEEHSGIIDDISVSGLHVVGIMSDMPSQGRIAVATSFPSHGRIAVATSFPSQGPVVLVGSIRGARGGEGGISLRIRIEAADGQAYERLLKYIDDLRLRMRG